MTRRYHYTVEGTAAAGQTWTVEGDREMNNFSSEIVMHEAFQQLTQGKAVFGRPGVGCNGPYQVTRLLIVRSTNGH